MPIIRTHLVALALGLVAAGCRDSAARTERVMVFAAASLTASFQALAEAFGRRHSGATIDLHFAGTPQLVLQLREGAPVDVFASADETNMHRVVATGKTRGEPVRFARNRLTIVTARGNPKGVRGLADFARADLRVLLCGPEVPAGRYARQALAKAGVVVQSVSDEPSVKAVVAKVRLGEVDAGVVYVTDVTAAPGQVDSVTIPDEHNVEADYPIVLVGAGGSSVAGAAFLAFVTSPDGQAILHRFGFTTP